MNGLNKNTALVIVLICAAVIFNVWLDMHYKDQNIQASNTNKAPTHTVKVPFLTKDITLGVGQAAAVGDINVSVDGITADNRCPVDVNCIVAGSVKARVRAIFGTTTITDELSSVAIPHEFMGYFISLTDVAPQRKSQTNIKASDYRLTLHVSQPK